MHFQHWVAQLSHQGHYVCPASTAVPIDVAGLRPDGTGFRLRCRGVLVTLALYRASRVGWEVRVYDPAWSPEDALAMWERRPFTGLDGRPLGARLVFEDESRPDGGAVYDGARERGWSSHEAGLLGVDTAADLLPRLLAVAEPAPSVLPVVGARHRPAGALR